VWCFQKSFRVLNARKLSSTNLCSLDSLGQLMWSHGPSILSKHSLTLPCRPKQAPTSCNEGVFSFFSPFLFKPPPPSHPIPFAWWCGLILWCVCNIGDQILVLISHKLPLTSPYYVYSELCGLCVVASPYTMLFKHGLILPHRPKFYLLAIGEFHFSHLSVAWWWALC
jgi:hypothetical protein